MSSLHAAFPPGAFGTPAAGGVLCVRARRGRLANVCGLHRQACADRRVGRRGNGAVGEAERGHGYSRDTHAPFLRPRAATGQSRVAPPAQPGLGPAEASNWISSRRITAWARWRFHSELRSRRTRAPPRRGRSGGGRRGGRGSGRARSRLRSGPGGPERGDGSRQRSTRPGGGERRQIARPLPAARSQGHQPLPSSRDSSQGPSGCSRESS